MLEEPLAQTRGLPNVEDSRTSLWVSELDPTGRNQDVDPTSVRDAVDRVLPESEKSSRMVFRGHEA